MNVMSAEIKEVDEERQQLEKSLKALTNKIGDIPIASPRIMPYGWRKSAKGRTVWRIVEEVISQNLEKYAKTLGFKYVTPADSEVGVYDFCFCLDGKNYKSFVNIKSSVKGGRVNKDDISKASGLINFYRENPDAHLYIATFILAFNQDMTIGLDDCIVMPTAWVPDIYVNPSNNGNLQSSMCKRVNRAIRRTNQEFLECLIRADDLAQQKRQNKLAR